MNPEKAKHIIRGHFNVPGFVLYPKGDGRVEIPQTIIHILSWENLKEVYIFIEDYRIFLSPTPETRQLIHPVGKTKVSQGRIRVPATFVKQGGMEKKTLSAAIDEDGFVEIRVNGVRGKHLTAAVNEIPDAIALRIANCLTEDKLNLVVPKKLIIPQTRQTICFRALQDPFRFRAYWLKSGDIVFGQYSQGPHIHIFYLIGGYVKLPKGKVELGYLLATQVLYDLFLAARRRASNEGTDPSNRDWIIQFDPTIREDFRVFNVPGDKHPEEENFKNLFDIDTIRKFVSNNFKRCKGDFEFSDPPVVINNINFRRGE